MTPLERANQLANEVGRGLAEHPSREASLELAKVYAAIARAQADEAAAAAIARLADELRLIRQGGIGR